MAETSKTILVIDDEVALCRIIETVLGQDGYYVLVAHSAAEAEELLRNTTFDLALADVRLPDSNGKAILDTIKSYAPDLPVIIITAYPSVSSAVEFIKAGANDYLEKPFNTEKLRLSVRQITYHIILC